LKKILQIALFFGIGAGLLYFVFQNQNTAFLAQCRLDGTPENQCSLWQKIISDFSSVNFGLISAVILAFTISNFARAARWLQLFEPLGHRPKFANAFWTIQLGYFANLGFPRAGELVRVGSFAGYEKLPVEQVTGTLVVDRLMDFICLIVVLGLGILVEGDTILKFINAKRGASGGSSLLQNPIVLSLILVAILGSILFFIFRKKITQLTVFQRVMKMAQGFLEGIRSVFRLKNPALFLGYSALIWICYFLQTWLCLKAFDPTSHLAIGAALMVFLFGTLGVVVPSPGGMGTYHLLAIAALSLYGIGGGDAFSFANIMFFTVNIFYMIIMGLTAFVVLPMINKVK
jgi:glycosyltransferase 2 family protein